MADPTISGSLLYAELAPIIEEEMTDGASFLSRIAAKISSYIIENDFVTGAYVGFIPTTPPTPSTRVVAIANFVPVSVSFAPPVLYDYITWLKNTFTYNPPGTIPQISISWNLTSLTHTFTPIPFNPLMETLEIVGDLSDIRTAEGFWAMTCDVIVWSILNKILFLQYFIMPQT